uniref:Uncharacterized protein n=1 Tax=Solanum tuberosum TaxID=4113 RepID=M1DJJ0_SOLTU
MFKMSPSRTRTEMLGGSTATLRLIEGFTDREALRDLPLETPKKLLFKLDHWNLHHGRYHGPSLRTTAREVGCGLYLSDPNFNSSKSIHWFIISTGTMVRNDLHGLTARKGSRDFNLAPSLNNFF